jgi:hypothetical protein
MVSYFKCLEIDVVKGFREKIISKENNMAIVNQRDLSHKTA